MTYDAIVYYMRDPHDPDDEVKRFVTVVDANDQGDAFDQAERVFCASIWRAFHASTAEGAMLNSYVRARDHKQRERDRARLERLASSPETVSD